MSVSVIIEAVNEERQVAAAVESALLATARAGVPGEVILADSASSDRTVEIAARHPIRVARLLDPRERSCGLGFQHAAGAFGCLIDGDMVLSPDIIAQGLAFIRANPCVAGWALRPAGATL